MRQFKRITATLLTFLLLVPFLTAVNAFAADESEDVDVWEDVLKPAYMKAEFTSIDERIKGDGNAIAAMEQKLVKDGYALYVDKKPAKLSCSSSSQRATTISVMRTVRMPIRVIIPPTRIP